MAQGHKTGGRQQGTPNKITTVFKDAVRIVYDDIGGHSAFAAWAKDNPGEFYKIAARLIPTEITMPEGSGLTIIVDKFCRGTVLAPDMPMLPATVEH